MWSIHRCVHEDATSSMLDDGGISNMRCKEADKKDNSTSVLKHMIQQAQGQKDHGYLTPGMLGLLDTQFYCAVWGGVNTAFSSGCGRGQTHNQLDAVIAHDAFLKARIHIHLTCVKIV